MNELKQFNLCYIASPYTLYPHGLPMAHRHIAKITGRLVIAGIGVISPIAHSHPVAIYGGVLPTAHEIWMGQAERIMSVCDALVIAKLDGWEQSKGIKLEQAFFQKMRRPIFYLDPKTYEVANAA